MLDGFEHLLDARESFLVVVGFDHGDRLIIDQAGP
jgi:hypothetical protein